jgi:acetyl esterase/lipase
MRYFESILCVLSVTLVLANSSYAELENSESDGIQVPSFVLPISNLLSEESKESIRQHALNMHEFHKNVLNAYPITKDTPINTIAALRQGRADAFLKTTLYKNTIKRYPASVERKTIDGVSVDVFTPQSGVSRKNKNRVLINLHGGGYVVGAKTYSYLESIPISSVGKIKVVSVNYSLSPEAYFPAGMDDIVTVYKALLKQYAPENIGIYGSSAGGVLTMLSIPRLQKEGLPIPGAITTINGSGNMAWDKGDFVYIVGAIVGGDFTDTDNLTWGYFKDFDMEIDDPLLFPVRHPDILKNFPPTLGLDSTRGFTMSSTVHAHSQLTKYGVKAGLHIWEGLDHYAIYNSELAETQDAYNVITRFFDKHLGQ